MSWVLIVQAMVNDEGIEDRNSGENESNLPEAAAHRADLNKRKRQEVA